MKLSWGSGIVRTGTYRGEMKFLGRNSQKWAQESRFSAESDGTKTEVSENGHSRVGHLEGRSAVPILRSSSLNSVGKIPNEEGRSLALFDEFRS